MLKIYDYIYYRFRVLFGKIGRKDPRLMSCALLSIFEFAIVVNLHLIARHFDFVFAGFLNKYVYIGVAVFLYVANCIRYLQFYDPNKYEPVWKKESNSRIIIKEIVIYSFVVFLLILIPVLAKSLK